MALFRTNQARQNLNDWLAQDPGRGSNSYGAALQSALANAAARKTPAQRYNTGADPNVAASRENYRLMAQRAADTAAAQTEALSGGYGADYAASAAEQGRQLLMEGQHDNEYALRQLALQGYAAENDQANAQTDALLAAQQLEQNANQMAMERFQAQRDFLTGEVQQAQTEQDNFWNQLVNGLMWAANVALQTYDNYKGYSQQQWENEFAMQQWEAEQAQQALLNQRYDTEYADSRADVAWEQALAEQQYRDSRADTAWEQGITERQLALDELASQDDHAYTQAQIANMGRSRSSGGSGSSYSSSATLTPSNLEKLVSGYQESMALGDTASAGIYADALASYGYNLGGNTQSAPALDLSSGLSLARSGIQRGWSASEIAESLIDYGFSDDEIAQIMNRVR